MADLAGWPGTWEDTCRTLPGAGSKTAVVHTARRIAAGPASCTVLHTARKKAGSTGATRMRACLGCIIPSQGSAGS